jgi:hypothetical protein
MKVGCDITLSGPSPHNLELTVSQKHSGAQLIYCTFEGKKYDTSSKLNRTPPIGAPNATATPAAEAALRISRRFPVDHS